MCTKQRRHSYDMSSQLQYLSAVLPPQSQANWIQVVTTRMQIRKMRDCFHACGSHFGKANSCKNMDIQRINLHFHAMFCRYWLEYILQRQVWPAPILWDSTFKTMYSEYNNLHKSGCSPKWKQRFDHNPDSNARDEESVIQVTTGPSFALPFCKRRI